MMLRSPWVATHIADPHNQYRLDDYFREAGLTREALLPVEKFVDYGVWFQTRVAPDLDTRPVMRVETIDGGFRLVLEDGDSFFAKRVVMATGLLNHEFRPAEFDGLPRSMASHSCDHADSQRYRGKRVAVIGRGQSACESAALLHEAGVDVEIICRGNLVWNADPVQRSTTRKAVRAMLGKMLIPPSQVGPFPYNWLNEAPGIIHNLTEAARETVNVRSLGATAIMWLRTRLKDVPVNQGRSIMAAGRIGDRVALTLDNGTRSYDHVLCATGYRFDVAKMKMLEPRLREKIARNNGLPALSSRFESSVPGLHFVGASAVGSFGPLLRFIAGAGFAARRVTRAAVRGSRATRAFADLHLDSIAAQAPLSLAAEREHP
jgi:FAD-dependent urate hydroxylase